MAGCNPFRLTVEEDNEETILGLDSESEFSDAEDLEYLLQDQAGVVGVFWNPALLKGPVMT